MKFTDVKTYIQSGNVLFKDCENDKLKITKRIEKALLNEFKDRIKVKILTLSEIENVLSNMPNDFGSDNKKYKYDLLFLIKPFRKEGIMEKIKIIENDDKIYEGEKVFYVKRNSEKLTGSYITQLLKISPNITVRNLNTTKKLYELMLERKENV